MTTLAGLDSAYEPSPADADAAWQAGYRVWAVYVAGPGALHNWSPAGIATVVDRGFLVVPVYVPRLDLSSDPERDAVAFMGRCSAEGLVGAGALDTEYSMRALGQRVYDYEAAFGDALVAHYWGAATYAGGFVLARPPKHHPWWIGIGVHAGTANQAGQLALPGGTRCDVDFFDSGFPMIGMRPPAPPPVPPLFSPDPLIVPGAAMPSTILTIPTDPHGEGWVMLDGSDARVSHLVVASPSVVCVEAQGSYPPADGYWAHTARWQDRGGHPCVSIVGGPPAAQANIRVVTSSPAAAMAEDEARERFGPDKIVTANNWQTWVAGSVDGFGGGFHDPRNATDA